MSHHFQVATNKVIFLKSDYLFSDFNKSIKTLVQRVDSLEKLFSPQSAMMIQRVPSVNTERHLTYYDISMYLKILHIISIFLLSEWNNPMVFNALKNEQPRRKPLGMTRPANDTLDEQLLEAKEWLLERTLNLR